MNHKSGLGLLVGTPRFNALGCIFTGIQSECGLGSVCGCVWGGGGMGGMGVYATAHNCSFLLLGRRADRFHIQSSPDSEASRVPSITEVRDVAPFLIPPACNSPPLPWEIVPPPYTHIDS